MADLSYSIGIDDSSAQRSLNNLKSTLAGIGTAIASAFAVREVVQVSARFEDLRLTLQTLYRDVGAGTRAFNDIKEFAKTSSFAVEDLVQTVLKLKSAGLEPNIALLRLFADVSGSVADKVGALQAITDLYARTTAGGLGLEDLNRLADRGIPVFQILSDKLGLSRLEITKVGQSAEGAALILKALEVGLAETFGGAAQAKANSLTQAMANFRDTINNLVDLLGRLGLNTALANFINALGGALESLKPYVALIGVGLAQAFQFLADNIKIVVAGLVALVTVFSVSVIVRLVQGVMLLTTAFGALGKTPVLKTLTFIAGVIAGLVTSFKTQGDAASEASDKVDELNRALKELEKGGELPLGQLAKDSGDLKGQVGGLNSELKAFNAEMANAVTNYAAQNAEQLRSFNLQTQLIRSTEEQRIAVETLQNAQEGYLRAIAPLLDQYNKLSASGKKEDLEKLPAIQKAIKGITDEYERGLPALQEGINLRIQELQIVKELEYQQKLLTAAEERRISVDEALNELLLRGPREAKRANEDYLNSTLTPLQRKLNEIAREERDLRDAALKRVAAQFTGQDGESMDPEGFARATQQAEDAARRNTELRQQQTREQYEQQRQFSSGWSEAFRNYVDNATNAANQARTYFEVFSRGIEDALVRFVRTGKLSFKDFANNIIAEFVRIEAKALVMKLFPSNVGGAGGGGGLFDIVKGIGSAIFGGFKAGGGPVTSNKAYIVGERGPEMFVPGSNGTIVPNNQLQQQPAMVTNVTYSIQAVDAASFKQLVARDPEFLFNVTEQARRNLPQRSRR